MIPKDTLRSKGRMLEEAFFIENDRVLVEKMKKLNQMKETKENLAKVSGIHNDAVLEKLVKLEIRPDVVAALALVPLIEVAWADGDIDARERAAVLKAAEKRDIERDGIEHQLLERWLEHKPEPRLLVAWTHYIEGLVHALGQDESRALEKELMGLTRSVAEASGGFLGLGSKVSLAEEAMIKRLETAFGH